MSLHVIVGAGPVGIALATLLADAGEQVRILTRSGTGPDLPGIERVQADAADAEALIRQADGAAALYNCANPPSYEHWEKQWPPLAAAFLTAAERTGAVLVVTGNLYGYGPVDVAMTTDLPLAAPGHKGRRRARMGEDARAAHEAGWVRATEVRASDYVGPGVGPANGMLARYVAAALAGRTVHVFGDPDVPHSFTYVPDVARALATVAVDERAWGRPWHVPSPPARTVRELLSEVTRTAGTREPRLRRVPRWLLRPAYPVVPLLREVDEVLYQWERPYVLDATATTEAFGLTATPWETIVPEMAGR